jgi:NAD(P)-dependent dehydrogenase (short-subunit alcohol dehydrogenase family)
MRLKDKVAIITGAAQGIGAAFAVGYAKEGAKVVIADINDGQDAVAAVENAGSEAISVKTDVSKQASCDAMAKAAVDRFGGIDILINNAGIFGDLVMKSSMELAEEEWDRVMAVNVGGPFRCMRAVFPHMKEKGGKIINIASAIIFEGVPGVPHYVASKGALMALSRSMAKELGGFDINVNAIAPGFTHSEGGDRFDQNKQLVQVSLEELQQDARCLKRTTKPEDLVGTAIFLATEDSRNITGQMIVVDCGLNFH